MSKNTTRLARPALAFFAASVCVACTAELDPEPIMLGGPGDDMSPAGDSEDMERGGPKTFEPVTDAPLAAATRPADIEIPAGYDNSREVALTVLLHGFTSNARQQDLLFQLARRTDSRDMIVVLPEGTTNSFGAQFWNATDACCDGERSGVDDSAYIRGLIDEAKERFRIDAGRVYLVGHSNGGFMAHRVACDHADAVTGIMSLAGATHEDMSQCQPSEPVSIIQVHGTMDTTILYEGGVTPFINQAYPSARGTVEQWARLNSCDASPATGDELDLLAPAGAETEVDVYTGCNDDATVQLWTVNGAEHIPPFAQPIYTDAFLDVLFSKDKTP
ncbi:MAG: PHB depolymerase family esterase [Myxococcota bacterium]